MDSDGDQSSHLVLTPRDEQLIDTLLQPDNLDDTMDENSDNDSQSGESSDRQRDDNSPPVRMPLSPSDVIHEQ